MTNKEFGELLTTEEGAKVVDLILRHGTENLLKTKDCGALAEEDSNARKSALDLVENTETPMNLFYYLWSAEYRARYILSNGTMDVDARMLPYV